MAVEQLNNNDEQADKTSKWDILKQSGLEEEFFRGMDESERKTVDKLFGMANLEYKASSVLDHQLDENRLEVLEHQNTRVANRREFLYQSLQKRRERSSTYSKNGEQRILNLSVLTGAVHAHARSLDANQETLQNIADSLDRALNAVNDERANDEERLVAGTMAADLYTLFHRLDGTVQTQEMSEARVVSSD